jgi:DNA invertase Pin-like site-specific DNA recombinase
MTFSGKVLGRHQDRLALVYVRQSTLRQVEQHQESTRLQYALVERALQLGWPRERVEVIDDDLGRSGASSANRPGFQRLVAEVGLGHVGLVLGVEMSRLARSCRDWHQLLEICALSDTLIADADGVYSTNDFNDRLLLGLKGTMSEAELHILKARMLEGRRAKALRGELHFNLPRGYIRSRTGEIVLDSDEQVQATIRLVFDTFERCHTINGVLHALVAHDIRLPHRVRSGPAKGELEWHAPNRYTLSEMLKSPLYAGAYAYGRRRAEKPSGPCRRGSEPTVLIKDRLPAYISWETYERNLAQVTANRSAHQGIARGGMALLAGLLVRPLRPAHGSAVSEWRPVPALQLLAAGRELWRGGLPIAQRPRPGRAGGRVDVAGADTGGAGRQPATDRGPRVGAPGIAPAMEAAA